ncbi:MAG: cytochrome c [Planctomycetota bacterium]
MPTQSYWQRPFAPLAKQAMLVFLIACFGLQTMLVYIDASTVPPLSQEAVVGRQLWHQHNCGSCHQFYGFGGFLGPDLTNAAPRLSDERLQSLLTEGSGQMPAFQLQPAEIAALKTFLIEMDKSGQGQAQAPALEAADPWTTFSGVAREQIPADAADELAGLEAMGNLGCFSTCHMPLQVSGSFPDLVESVATKPESEILQVLDRGRPPAMPDPALEPQQIPQVYRFLSWVQAHRDAVQEEVTRRQSERRMRWLEVPWWEY